METRGSATTQLSLHTPEPMTLRRLVEMVGPEFLDVPLSLIVRDGRNSVLVAAPVRLDHMPREAARAPDYTGRLALQVYLDDMRLVRKASAKAVGSAA